MTKSTIAALMQDHPGALTRAVSLFRRRGFNIHSIAVGPSETPGVARMTLVVDAAHVEQVCKQLNRLIDVIKVCDLTEQRTLERETALIKVHAPANTRADIVALCTIFHAHILDAGSRSLVIELTASPSTLDRFTELVRPFGLKEIARTGQIAMVCPSHRERPFSAAAPPDESRPEFVPNPLAL